MKIAAAWLCALPALAPALAQDPVDPAAPQLVPNEPGTAPAPASPSAGSAEPSADKPLIPTFQRGSGQRAGGPANELNTGDSRAEEKLPGGSVTGALAGRELYHGHYCGRGARDATLPAVDDLDAACQRHDQCYDRARYPSCACDQALKREAVSIADSSAYSREVRARAGSIVQAAELMECRRP